MRLRVIMVLLSRERLASPSKEFVRRDAGAAGHDLSGRAIAALEGVALDEGGLQGMELLSLGEALDGRDLTTFDKCGERKARLHALAVHEDSAGAAQVKFMNC
jgi:hypothetical protein